MNTASIIDVFNASHAALMANLAGIDDAASMAQPATDGNCINWLAGHLLFARDGIMRMLRAETYLTEEEIERYRRGTAGLKAGDEHTDIKRLVKGLVKTHKQAIAALEKMPDKLLGKRLDPKLFPYPVENPNIGTMLGVLLFHEGYHAGQIGLLRRIAGMDGAIK